MSLLVTGGCGYIGSHTVVELLSVGERVVIVDNLSNSDESVLDRICEITGKCPEYIKADICDKTQMRNIFSKYNISSVLHFAGLKAVGQSCEQPLDYYHNNVSGTINLLEVMAEFNCKNLVFSSSATVYGEHNSSPLVETMSTSATNPYGRTKLIIEKILFDLANCDSNWSIISLRYFNPIGAHTSGLIGENPNGIPNNLLPYLSKVAVGQLPQLQIFGDDYDTLDGTGVRDYIHVVDLAIGHLKAIYKLSNHTGYTSVNLGTGKGTSVMEIVNMFITISGRDIPYVIAERRAGDIGTVYANVDFAREFLNWRAERDLVQMIEDTWRWQSGNHNGYTKS
jgi:UDP-glucose 4-epimerase